MSSQLPSHNGFEIGCWIIVKQIIKSIKQKQKNTVKTYIVFLNMSSFLTGLEMVQCLEWCVYENVAWPVLLLVSRNVRTQLVLYSTLHVFSWTSAFHFKGFCFLFTSHGYIQTHSKVQHICTINVDGNSANVEQPTPDAMSSRDVTMTDAAGSSDDHVYEKLQLKQSSTLIQVAALEGFVNERDDSGFVQEYNVSVCH